MRRHTLAGAMSALAVTGGVLAAAAPVHADSRAGSGAPSKAEPQVEVLASGLVGPLSLAVDDDGTQWVTENFTGRLLSQPAGATDALQQRFATADGSEVGGVSVAKGVLRFTVTQGNNEEGRVSTLKGNGKEKVVADTGAHEEADNPDGSITYGFRSLSKSCAAQLPQDGPPARYKGVDETHPYSTAQARGITYVADAGANDVLAVSKNGTVRTVAVIKPQTFTITPEAAEGSGYPECTVGKKYRYEAVPTDVEVGPDGQLYVSTLAGGPENGSLATGQVLRINPATGKVNTVVDGLVSATGVAVADNGDVFVSQLFAGVISRIPTGTKTVEPYASVPLPADVDAGDDGLYAAINVLPGPDGPPDGQLVRITASDNDDS